MITFLHHREMYRLWQDFLVIVGMAEPELRTAYEPGWVKRDLPAIDAEEFDGAPPTPVVAKPRKRSRK